MDNEKNKDLAMAFEDGKTIAGDMVSRRSWHKPAIKRIDIKRTMSGTGSNTDLHATDPGSQNP